MKRFACLIAMVLALAVAMGPLPGAAYYQAPLDIALRNTSIVFVGRTISVADAGRREIALPGEVWVFDHAVATVVVGEVLRSPAHLALAAGDTVEMYFATANDGYRRGAARPSVSVAEVAMPGPPLAGETAAYCGYREQGELRFACRLSEADVRALRAAPAAPPLAPAQLTAVTLNLWHDQHDWPARRAVVVDTLRALRPDVIFLQEVLEKEGLPNQAQQLADSLGYAFRFASVDPVGGTKRYGNAILARHAITASHEVKLAPLDDWRVAAHARLLLPDGRYLDAYATHLHHTGEGGAIRAEQVGGLLAFVDSTRAGGAALVIGGDFNAEADRAELAPLFARFTDVLAAADPRAAATAATFGPATSTPPRRIDYLFSGATELAVEAARVILGAPTAAGVWGSDHSGVWARWAVRSQ